MRPRPKKVEMEKKKEEKKKTSINIRLEPSVLTLEKRRNSWSVRIEGRPGNRGAVAVQLPDN